MYKSGEPFQRHNKVLSVMGVLRYALKYMEKLYKEII